MTPELGPDARSILGAARGAGPDPAAIARMRGNIELAISVPATPAASPVGKVSVSSAKLGLLAFVIVAATGAGVIATSTRGSSKISDTVHIPKIDRAVTGNPDRVTDRMVTTRQPPIAPPSSKQPEQPARDATPHAPSSRVTRAFATKAVAPVAVDLARRGSARAGLAREVELVDRAMIALRRGELRQALAAVRLHATETSNKGQLAEDAAAIEIEALCTLHDPAFARRLAVFDVQWPASAQRARLTKICR